MNAKKFSTDEDSDELSLESGDSYSSEPASDSKDEDNSSTSALEEDIVEEKERLVQRETKLVFRLKILLLLVLIAATITITVIVYRVIRDAEVEEFETQYQVVAQQVIDLFHKRLDETLGSISSLVVATTGYGADHDRNWPFIALSWFQERSVNIRGNPGALMVTLNPRVSLADRANWENYTWNDSTGNAWYEDGIALQENLGYDAYGLSPRVLEESPRSTPDPDLDVSTGIADRIFYVNPTGHALINDNETGYLPTWQTAPVFGRTYVNENILKDPKATEPANAALSAEEVTFGGLESAPAGTSSDAHLKTSFYAALLSISEGTDSSYQGDPMARIYFPIYDSFRSDHRVVGSMVTLVHWGSLLRNILPEETAGIRAVLENTCEETFTYQIDGPVVEPIGFGDSHDQKFDHLEYSFSSLEDITTIEDGTPDGIQLNKEQCTYNLRIYPTSEFRDASMGNIAVAVTVAVMAVFVFTAAMFLVYDRLVERRQKIILSKAEQTSAIVASLFPKNVRDRLMAEGSEKGGKSFAELKQLKEEMEGEGGGNSDKGRPNADLFPHCTVLFGDIAGFTAWSSSRDPPQVFTLLEAIYNEFDKIARKRRVFKVETIGDCYVAVAGLPDPQDDHAVIMAKFAWDCLNKMNDVTRELETSLGPDTGDLSMRIGIHSGPVTAGVLRGERSRFQLFGDTVNTAARMESTGSRDRIQCSHFTAELLFAAGKDHWLSPRENAVEAKGKGVLHTYWVIPHKKSNTTINSSETGSDRLDFSSHPDAAVADKNTERKTRLVDWVTELLAAHIQNIMANRRVHPLGNRSVQPLHRPTSDIVALDEVADAIALPKFDEYTSADTTQAVEVSPVVLSQLHEYLWMVASSYQDNPFHNFEHACHVTMSVSKFLRRLVSHSLYAEEASPGEGHSLGIDTDPIAQFAIVLSAVIHDAGHRGVSNAQLMKEDSGMAEQYRNKSVAEQHSLSIGWDLLMSDRFSVLRNSVFATDAELARFRQVLVNVVLATDIFDKEINSMRLDRWKRAFSTSTEVGPKENRNLQATVVIEHIIQAADVSHTMQHWHIYLKWNKRLLKELIIANLNGRMQTNPATFWYKGELGFFDFYVIPLANKLKECGVFGVGGDECLNYAIKNRAEWEAYGEDCVAEMVQEIYEEIGGEPGIPKPAKNGKSV